MMDYGGELGFEGEWAFPRLLHARRGVWDFFVAKWWNSPNTALGAESLTLPELKRCKADANEVVKRAIVVFAFSGVIFLLTWRNDNNHTLSGASQ